MSNLGSCDVMLPGLHGDCLVSDIYTLFATRGYPILLMSASADPHVTLRDVSFMPKPFDSVELLDRIQSMLKAPSGAGAVPAN